VNLPASLLATLFFHVWAEVSSWLRRSAMLTALALSSAEMRLPRPGCRMMTGSSSLAPGPASMNALGSGPDGVDTFCTFFFQFSSPLLSAASLEIELRRHGKVMTHKDSPTQTMKNSPS
jgi:hypothetical protein